MTGFYITLYLGTLAAFFIIDIIWLTLVARRFYSQQLGSLMAPRTRWLPAVIFYLLFIAGLLVFVVLPGLAADSLSRTLLTAAFFGLVTYATYDLTNLATIRDWPWKMTLVDLVWGTVLSVLVSLASFFIGKGLG